MIKQPFQDEIIKNKKPLPKHWQEADKMLDWKVTLVIFLSLVVLFYFMKLLGS